jgi:hypothetical protein
MEVEVIIDNVEVRSWWHDPGEAPGRQIWPCSLRRLEFRANLAGRLRRRR